LAQHVLGNQLLLVVGQRVVGGAGLGNGVLVVGAVAERPNGIRHRLRGGLVRGLLVGFGSILCFILLYSLFCIIV